MSIVIDWLIDAWWLQIGCYGHELVGRIPKCPLNYEMPLVLGVYNGNHQIMQCDILYKVSESSILTAVTMSAKHNNDYKIGNILV